MKQFIENMIRYRKDRGWTQTDLAESVGTQQPAISRIERGEEDITLTRAESIAKALGMTLNEMISAPELQEA